MKQYYPAYYNAFRCIAADCPDSCCQGWDVAIDSDTERFYRTVDGEFGEKLRGRSIPTVTATVSFALKIKRNALSGERTSCAIFTERSERISITVKPHTGQDRATGFQSQLLHKSLSVTYC